MKSSTFLIIITIVTVLMFGVAFLLFANQYQDDTFRFINAGIAVSYLTTVGAYLLSQAGLFESVTKFLTFLLGSMFAKMVIGIAIIALVIVFYGQYKKPYVFSYFFSYFIHTSFEVFGLMRNLRPFSKKEGLENTEK